jgi:hypothetical protein
MPVGVAVGCRAGSRCMPQVAAAMTVRGYLNRHQGGNTATIRSGEHVLDAQRSLLAGLSVFLESQRLAPWMKHTE